jgi:hypothetical protein
METEEEILMAASRKRRQCSRFLGRRLVQSSAVSAGVLAYSVGVVVSLSSRVHFEDCSLVARKMISHS